MSTETLLIIVVVLFLLGGGVGDTLGGGASACPYQKLRPRCVWKRSQRAGDSRLSP
jgi:hypothetical protein